VGSVLGAALTNRRRLASAEGSVLIYMAAAVLVVSVVVARWPAILAWPLAAIGLWLGTAWLYKAITLLRGTRTAAPALARKEEPRV
jgi:cardiolipin synthase